MNKISLFPMVCTVVCTLKKKVTFYFPFFCKTNGKHTITYFSKFTEKLTHVVVQKLNIIDLCCQQCWVC